MESKFDRDTKRRLYEGHIKDDLSLDEVLMLLSPNDSPEEGEKLLIEIGARLALARQEDHSFAEDIKEATECVLDKARELEYAGKYESLEAIKSEAKECIVTAIRVFLGDYQN